MVSALDPGARGPGSSNTLRSPLLAEKGGIWYLLEKPSWGDPGSVKTGTQLICFKKKLVKEHEYVLI